MVVINLAIPFFENFETCLSSPLLYLLIRRVEMIHLFVWPLAVDNRQSGSLSPFECLLDLVFICIFDRFGREIKKALLFKRPMEITKYERPIFGTDIFHGIHADHAIENSSIGYFL